LKITYPLAIFVLAAITAPLCLLRAQAPDAASRSVWDGVYTEEQAKRGEPIYKKECAACHGDMLTGGESAPPLTGGEMSLPSHVNLIGINSPYDNAGLLS